MELEAGVSFFKILIHLTPKPPLKNIKDPLVTASITFKFSVSSPLTNSQIQAYLSPEEISVTVFYFII